MAIATKEIQLSHKDRKRFIQILHNAQRTENGCILWPKCKDRDGYGQLRVNGRMVKAHRVSYILFKGKIPADMFVLHKCDTPQCLAIEHLFLGTNKDNMRDMIAKNRAAHSTGEQNPRAKLTEEDVKRIRRLYASGKYTQERLANAFNIDNVTISEIVNYITWKHIP